MRLAIISDIHEDVVNLTKALRMIEKANCDEIICLGDIVGFSVPYYKYIETRNANRCISLISENVKYVVAGNHDHYAIRKLPTIVPGFNLPADWYELPFYKRKELAANQLWLFEDNELSALLDDQSKEYINNLPEMTTIQAENLKILLTHFLSPDITGITKNFIYTSGGFSSHHELMIGHEASLSLFGHTHQNGMYIFDCGNGNPIISKKTKISASLCSIGIPAIASSNGFSGFAILDTEKCSIEVRSIRPVFNLISG